MCHSGHLFLGQFSSQRGVGKQRKRRRKEEGRRRGTAKGGTRRVGSKTKFGQTKFGQTKFGQYSRINLSLGCDGDTPTVSELLPLAATC